MCEIKLSRVFSNLLRTDYKITDDTMLEKLLTHLGDEKGEGSQLLALPACETWVKSVLVRWWEGKISCTIVSFALRLWGLIMKDEMRFKTFIFNEAELPFMERLAAIMGPSGDGAINFSIKCAYLKMLKSFAQHSSGQQWILQTSIWQMVLLCRADKSMFVVREARSVMAKLLNSAGADDDSQKEEILSVVLSPLMLISIPPKNQTSLCAKPSTIIDKANLVSTLQVLCEILVGALETVDPSTGIVKSAIARPLNLSRFCLERRLRMLIEMFDEDVPLEFLSKALILYYITTYASNIIKTNWSEDIISRFRNLCNDILNLQEVLIQKSNVRAVMKTCELCLAHWHVVTLFAAGGDPNKKIDGISPGTRGSFEVQQLCLHMMPMFIGWETSHDDAHDLFVTKLCNISTERLFRLIYAYRDVIVKMTVPESTSVSCINGLMSIKTSLSKENAVIVFQAFVYVLKSYAQRDESIDLIGNGSPTPKEKFGWGGTPILPPTPAYISAILRCLSTIMSMFRITWRDSVESICLLSLPLNVLTSRKLVRTVGLKVDALKLVKLCIENYFPPDLALLNNSFRGATVDQLGRTIVRLMNDPSWEVRDSNLELVLSISTMANIKYPALQELIEENRLCEMIVEFALNDSESYVCASGIRCLSAMVLMDKFWNEKLEQRKLPARMINFINGDGGDPVRTEATNLILQIYEHRKIEPDLLNDVYILMSKVIMSDFHWEVKVNAVRFWKVVIEKHLNDQGMIDGMFPEVTFSKEHRKIIKLTPETIQLRLSKTLDCLSRIGCLQVLFEALLEDDDIHVMTEASKVLNFVANILRTHGLLSPACCKPATEGSPKSIDRQKSLPVESSQSQTDFTQQNFFVDGDTHFDDSELSSLLDFAASNLDLPDLNHTAQIDHSIQQNLNQDEIIDAILKDKDISLLANVYRGFGAVSPMNEIDDNLRKRLTNPMKASEFLEKLNQVDVDAHVEGHRKWAEEATNDMESLLNDMLINVRDDQEYNIADCY